MTSAKPETKIQSRSLCTSQANKISVQSLQFSIHRKLKLQVKHWRVTTEFATGVWIAGSKDTEIAMEKWTRFCSYSSAWNWIQYLSGSS